MTELVIILAITSKSQKVPFPLAYELTQNFLPKPSWVKIDQIRTLSVKRLGHKLAHLDEEEVNRIIEGLNGYCRTIKTVVRRTYCVLSEIPIFCA